MGRQTNSVYHCTANCEAGQNPGNTGPAGIGSWHTQWVHEGEAPGPCPHCGADVRTSPHETKYGNSEYYSEALGVAPNQIAEARAQFPHHEFAPDGRMRVRSPQHRKQIMRDIGYRDNN